MFPSHAFSLFQILKKFISELIRPIKIHRSEILSLFLDPSEKSLMKGSFLIKPPIGGANEQSPIKRIFGSYGGLKLNSSLWKFDKVFIQLPMGFEPCFSCRDGD